MKYPCKNTVTKQSKIYIDLVKTKSYNANGIIMTIVSSQSILSRVDRLQSEAKYVLQCASVIGRLFKHRLLDHLTHQERELNRYINEFEDRELIYEERMVLELEYAFKHALTQEVTYQGILERRRQEFHYQVGEGIEALYQERLEEYYIELAYHYSRSADNKKAVDYLIKAGDRCKQLYANQDAIKYFNDALSLLDEGISRRFCCRSMYIIMRRETSDWWASGMERYE
jgi:predicted ATPase